MKWTKPELPDVAVAAAVEQRLRNGDSRALDSLVPLHANKFFKVIFDGNLVAIAEDDLARDRRHRAVFGTT